MTAADVQPHVSKAGAITALTFRNLKQLTIEESFDIGKKHAASRGFLAIARGSCLYVYRRVLLNVKGEQVHGLISPG